MAAARSFSNLTWTLHGLDFRRPERSSSDVVDAFVMTAVHECDSKTVSLNVRAAWETREPVESAEVSRQVECRVRALERKVAEWSWLQHER